MHDEKTYIYVNMYKHKDIIWTYNFQLPTSPNMKDG